MAIKLMLLKTGETLITDAKEVVQEEQVRGYMLSNDLTSFALKKKLR